MPKQLELSGFKDRKKVFRARLNRLLEETMLRQYEYEHLVPDLNEDRIKYWKFVGAPTQEALTLLAQVFRVPTDYLWPPMPEDGAELDRDRIRQDLWRLQAKAQKGKLTPEEQERYQILLEIEKRLSGVGYITFSLRPVPKLVCVLRRLPLRPEDLPPWTAAWDGAMVVPMEGVKPADPVYAYKLQHRLDDFEAGTTVIFRPLYTEPEEKDTIIGVHRGLPHIAHGKDFPAGGTPLGRVVMSIREH